MSDARSDAGAAIAPVADRLLAERRRRRGGSLVFAVVLFAAVAWSVDVTIVEDTDWERMGSLANVLEAAGEFVGVDWDLFPDLAGPALETFMIACLGTLLGVLVCIPVTWFGALNITPFKPVTYPLARLMMTLSRSIHEIVVGAVLRRGGRARRDGRHLRARDALGRLHREDVGGRRSRTSTPGRSRPSARWAATGSRCCSTRSCRRSCPQILGVIVFEWEINIRRSAVLGLVGAGGLGLMFFRQMNTFNFPGVTTVLIAIFGIILIGEVVSHFARKAVI